MEQVEVERMMSRRYRPAAPADLAERIIYAAVNSIQDRAVPRNIWAEIGAMFALPHPRVVVAMSVLIGVVVGFQAADGLVPLGQDWSSFLYINEGGWL
jgi:hypothetical protein